MYSQKEYSANSRHKSSWTICSFLFRSLNESRTKEVRKVIHSTFQRWVQRKFVFPGLQIVFQSNFHWYPKFRLVPKVRMKYVELKVFNLIANFDGNCWIVEWVEDIIIKSNYKFERSICSDCKVVSSIIFKLDKESSSEDRIVGKSFLDEQSSIIKSLKLSFPEDRLKCLHT